MFFNFPLIKKRTELLQRWVVEEGLLVILSNVNTGHREKAEELKVVCTGGKLEDINKKINTQRETTGVAIKEKKRENQVPLNSPPLT